MSYLQGSGTQGAPFLIHNIAAFVQWLTDTTNTAAYYAVLVADLDFSGKTIAQVGPWRGHLDGNGHIMANLTMGGQDCLFYGSMKRIVMDSWKLASGLSYPTFRLYIGGSITDCLMIGTWNYPGFVWLSDAVVTRCVSMVNSLTIQSLPSSRAINCYALGTATDTGYTNLSSNPDRYNPANYVGINVQPATWLFDGSSAPRLIIQDTSQLTTAYAIKGTTKVGGQPKSRLVSGHSPVDFHQFAKVTSTAADGRYLLNCGRYTDHVAVVHSDNYGKLFSANSAYALGDVIHPSTPNGYRYICTTAGTSSAAEPTNWPTTGTLTSGSAIFTAQPVYKPETFIAVPVLIDLFTGLPV